MVNPAPLSACGGFMDHTVHSSPPSYRLRDFGRCDRALAAAVFEALPDRLLRKTADAARAARALVFLHAMFTHLLSSRDPHDQFCGLLFVARTENPHFLINRDNTRYSRPCQVRPCMLGF